MKKLRYLLILILFFPFCVFAKEDVTIEKIESVDKSSEDIIDSISFEGLSIDNQISFLDVGDYIQYEITINNPTSMNYLLSDDSMVQGSDHFSYRFESGSDSVVKAKSKTKLTLTVSYDEEVVFDSDESYVETNRVQIPIEEVAGVNPQTFTTIYYLTIIVFILVVGTLFFLLYTRGKGYITFILILSLCIPFLTYAYEELVITIHSEISVVNPGSVPVVPPEEPQNHPKFCVVRGTTIDSEKDYYEFEDGMTTEEWNNSSYKTFDMTWDSFIDTDGAYTNIDRIGNVILDSSNGCYYNGLIDIEVSPIYLNLVSYYQNGYYSDSSSSFEVKTCQSTQTVAECFGNLFDDKEIYRYSGKLGECYRSVHGTSGNSRASALTQCTANYGIVNKKVSPNDLIGNFSYFYLDSIMRFGCLSGDTEIEVYDKKKKKRCKKKLRDVTYDDLVLAWDFENGEFVWVEPFWIMEHKQASEYILLTFSDGSTLKVIGDHRIYNRDIGRFTSIKDEKSSPIGMTTLNSNGDIVSLTSREYITGTIDYCNIITNHHINVFANGILTSHGINNCYPIENDQFVVEERDSFTKEDFAVEMDVFDGLNLSNVDANYLGNKEDTRRSLMQYIQTLMNTKK